MARKAPKGESTRSETLTIRLTPKIKYGLELQARKQHRTLAGVVEWAIEKGLKDEKDGLVSIITRTDNDLNEYGSISTYLLNFLWDPEEICRLYNLADNMSELMTYEEQKLYVLINKNAYYWRLWSGKNIEKDLDLREDQIPDGYLWCPECHSNLLLDRVKEDLPVLKEIVNETASVSSLKYWLPLTQIYYYRVGDLEFNVINNLSKEQMKVLEFSPIEKINEEKELLRKKEIELTDNLLEDLKARLDDSPESKNLVKSLRKLILEV